MVVVSGRSLVLTFSKFFIEAGQRLK